MSTQKVTDCTYRCMLRLLPTAGCLPPSPPPFPRLLFRQEHKLQEGHIEGMKARLEELLPGYISHWSASTVKKGYSGVVVLLKTPPASGGTGGGKKSAAAQSVGCPQSQGLIGTLARLNSPFY